jgi:hypothetical protein
MSKLRHCDTRDSMASQKGCVSTLPRPEGARWLPGLGLAGESVSTPGSRAHPHLFARRGERDRIARSKRAAGEKKEKRKQKYWCLAFQGLEALSAASLRPGNVRAPYRAKSSASVNRSGREEKLVHPSRVIATLREMRPRMPIQDPLHCNAPFEPIFFAHACLLYKRSPRLPTTLPGT